MDGFYVAFTNAGDRRAFRSTKKSKLGEAQKVGLKWAREAAEFRMAAEVAAGKPTPLTNPNSVLERFIDVTRAAGRGEFTETVAREFLDDLLTATGQKTLSGHSSALYLREWVGQRKITRADGTFKRYERTIEDFIASLGRKAELALSAITATDIERYRDAELKAGKRAATVETAIKVLNAAFTKARRQGLILSVPTEAVDALPRDGAERRAFTPAEIQKVLAVSDWQWKGMVVLAYHTGLRIQDCARLTWAEIDSDRHVIVLRPQKERRDREAKKRETFMPPELREFLLSVPIKGRKSSAPLFPDLHGKRSGGKTGLSLTFRDLLTKAGVAFADVSDGRGRKFYDLGFHSLRHTAVSAMANAGVSEELRKEHVGHSSEVYRRYTHLELATFEKALANVPQILRGDFGTQ